MAGYFHLRNLLLSVATISLAGCIPGGDVETARRPAPGPGSSSTAAPVPPPPPPAPAAQQQPVWVARPVAPDAANVQGQKYRVRSGDTLSGIAVKTGASVEAIARANGIAPPYAIRDGQLLVIPAGRYHLVRRGDSGIAIARAYGVDWSTIIALNELQEPYLLREGQRLLLPSPREAASMSIEQRARAFQLDIDDIATGGEPALAANETPPPAPPPTPAPPARTASAATPAAPVPPVAPTTPVAAPAGTFDGRFVWPLQGKVLRGFGAFGDGRRNDGLNIAARRGASVKAAADGVVAYVGSDVAIYGGLILLRHADGWLTAYGHVEKQSVQRGQSVKRGQVIGQVGTSALDEQDQLHFQIRKGRQPVDPRLYLPK